jgi:hypothetical protein
MSEVRALPTSHHKPVEVSPMDPGRIGSRASTRHLRDIERGYSINVKQVVLAFAVEFFIIGLILVGQYLIAEQAAQEKVFSILLFPIGLAVVELARVPLAIAVRTQNSWSVKFFAALGVLSAVVVTSFSLSTIAYQTFDPRLIEVDDKANTLHSVRSEKNILGNEISVASGDIDAKTKARDEVNDRVKDLQSQITKISTTQGQNCTFTTSPVDGTQQKHCTPTNVVNKAQLTTLQTQLAKEGKALEDAESSLKAAEARRAQYDPRAIDEKIAKAETEYRVAVSRSNILIRAT